jgi:hypothetical protein
VDRSLSDDSQPLPAAKQSRGREFRLGVNRYLLQPFVCQMHRFIDQARESLAEEQE